MQETCEETLHVKTRPRYMTRLRYFVEGHGIKLTWIGKMARISYPRLYRLYSGATEPTVKEALALAQVLSCQLDDLFDLDDPKHGDGHDRIN